jgi:hypothetical protein
MANLFLRCLLYSFVSEMNSILPILVCCVKSSHLQDDYLYFESLEHGEIIVGLLEYPSQNEAKILDEVVSILSQEYPKDMSSDELWEMFHGPVMMFECTKGILCRPFILLATTFFTEDKKLDVFCRGHGDNIKKQLIDDFNKVWKGRPLIEVVDTIHTGLKYGYASEFPYHCPSIFSDSSELRWISFSHALYRYSLESFQPGNKALSIVVERESAFDNFVSLFRESKPSKLYQTISGIRLVGEEGVGHGVTREWFRAIATQIFSSRLFDRSDSKTQYLVINSDSAKSVEIVAGRHRDTPDVFRAIGGFLALCLVHQVTIGIDVSGMMFSKLMGQEITLEDAKRYEPELVNSFEEILKWSDEALLGLEIEINRGIFLINRDNRKNLIKMKVNSLIEESVHLEDMRKGFQALLPTRLFESRVTGEDIRRRLLGEEYLDIEDMKKFARISGNLNKNSPRVKWLWNILRSFGTKDRKRFLRFVTGLESAPVGGFRSVPIVVTSSAEKPDHLPKAHTCSYQIDLPEYPSEKVMKIKLLRAIAEDQMGFQ